MLSFVLAFAGAGQVSQTQWDQEKANKDPMICTQGSIGSEVGTHLKSKKVCMTKFDRDFAESEQRATVNRIVNDGNDRQRYIPAPR